LLLLVAMSAAAITWGRRQLLALEVFREQWSQDLAFFNQILSSALDGRPWTSPILLEPTGFFDMVHFHPVFALILPLYALAPGIQILVLINVVAVVAAAWPMAELGRESSGRSWVGLAAGLAFLVWAPTEAAAGADFRPMALWIPALAWMLLGLYKGALRIWLPAAVLVCLIREESVYVLPLCGLVLFVVPWGGWKRREGLGLLTVGLVYVGVLWVVKGNFFYHFDPRKMLEGLGTAPDVPAELLADRWQYLRHSLLGGYLFSLAAPAPLAMSTGPAWWLWTDTHREWHGFLGTTVYLRSALLPLWAGAGTVGAGLLIRRWPQLVWPVGIWLIVGNLVTFTEQRDRLARRAELLRQESRSDEVAALRRLVAQVEPDDRVATEYKPIAALSGRRVIWNVNHMYTDDGQPPHWSADWPLGLDRVDTVLLPIDHPFTARLQPEFGLGHRAGGWGLWRRTVAPTGGMPEPLN
jgi:hypothetical protein